MAFALGAGGSSDVRTPPRSGLFADVASARGLDSAQPGLEPCGFNAAGAAWADVEGDGDLDLFLAQQQGRSELWIQGSGGRFREAGSSAGVDAVGIATAAAFGDYDSDGDPDLYVGAHGPGALLENRGDGTFTRALVGEAGAPTEALTAKSVSWVDFDRDGRLDLFVANGANCVDEPPPAPNELYRNRGPAGFVDRSDLLPAEVSRGVTLDAIWLETAGGRRPQLYLGNDDLAGVRNALIAPGSGGFSDVTAESGAGVSAFTMGVDAGDLDGNGLADLVVTDIGRESLLLQRGPGRFEDQAAASGFGRELVGSGERSVTWGIAIADFDNDADLDAYAAAGALGLDREDQDDVLYLNDGSGSFSARTVAAPGSGRTVAPADWDGDGDTDLLVTQLNGAPLLFENRTPPGRHWIGLDLIGRRSSRQPCGAVVTLRSGATQQQRTLDCRAGASGVRFGLGESSAPQAVTIVWPRGTSQALQGLAPDREHTIREPRVG